MAYTVRPDGSIEVGSLEEALALSKRITASRLTTPPPEAASKAPAKPDVRTEAPAPAQQVLNGWPMFVSNLGLNQQRLLRALQESHECGLEELQERVGVESNQAVTGVISGIVKNARKFGLSPDSLLWGERGRDGRPIYNAGPMLLNAPPIMVLQADEREEPEEPDA